MSKHKVKRKKQKEDFSIESSSMTYDDYLKYWGEDQESSKDDIDED